MFLIFFRIILIWILLSLIFRHYNTCKLRMNPEWWFYVSFKVLNLIFSPFLGILIVCLPLILKKSLICRFNISSVMKACEQ